MPHQARESRASPPHADLLLSVQRDAKELCSIEFQQSRWPQARSVSAGSGTPRRTIRSIMRTACADTTQLPTRARAARSRSMRVRSNRHGEISRCGMDLAPLPELPIPKLAIDWYPAPDPTPLGQSVHGRRPSAVGQCQNCAHQAEERDGLLASVRPNLGAQCCRQLTATRAQVYTLQQQTRPASRGPLRAVYCLRLALECQSRRHI